MGLSSDKGTASDHLTLRGGLAGAWLGFSLGERFPLPLHFRLGAGALVGTLLIERTGRFQSSTSGEAYNVEMGLTNELFPNEREEDANCQFNALPESPTPA